MMKRDLLRLAAIASAAIVLVLGVAGLRRTDSVATSASSGPTDSGPDAAPVSAVMADALKPVFTKPQTERYVAPCAAGLLALVVVREDYLASLAGRTPSATVRPRIGDAGPALREAVHAEIQSQRAQQAKLYADEQARRTVAAAGSASAPGEGFGASSAAPLSPPGLVPGAVMVPSSVGSAWFPPSTGPSDPRVIFPVNGSPTDGGPPASDQRPAMKMRTAESRLKPYVRADGSPVGGTVSVAHLSPLIRPCELIFSGRSEGFFAANERAALSHALETGRAVTGNLEGLSTYYVTGMHTTDKDGQAAKVHQEALLTSFRSLDQDLANVRALAERIAQDVEREQPEAVDDPRRSGLVEFEALYALTQGRVALIANNPGDTGSLLHAETMKLAVQIQRERRP